MNCKIKQFNHSLHLKCDPVVYYESGTIEVRYLYLYKVIFLTIKCAFGLGLKIKIISLFNLFLLLFMSLTVFFGIIHGSHCIISANFYLYL